MSEHLNGVLDHKRFVAAFMQRVASSLFKRAILHDYSKFSPEEFDAFEEATPLLKTLEYGSDAYKAALRQIQPAIDHHYAMNRHHPEFFAEGINGMNLIDLIEMVCDWMAAVQRVKDGHIQMSLLINKKRFGIDDQLFGILANTVAYLESPQGEE